TASWPVVVRTRSKPSLLCSRDWMSRSKRRAANRRSRSDTVKLRHDAEQERLRQHRDQVAAELPDLAARDQMRKDAREEATLSGELRRAVHGSDATLGE